MEIIRSRQNPLVKHLVKLMEQRRERLKERQTLLVGTHLIESALAAKWRLERLLVCEGQGDHPEIASLLALVDCPVTWLTPELFAEIEQTPSTTGLLGLITLPAPPRPPS